MPMEWLLNTFGAWTTKIWPIEAAVVKLVYGLHPRSSKVVKLMHGLHQEGSRVVELEVGHHRGCPGSDHRSPGVIKLVMGASP